MEVPVHRGVQRLATKRRRTAGGPTLGLKRGGLLAGAAIGVLAAATALGVGELIAVLVRPESSPVIAVGDRLIELTPESVKRWAIDEFGTNDKNVLLSGIYVVLAVLAALIGILARRRLGYGLAGIALFAAFGAYCADSVEDAEGPDVLPVLIGAVAAAALLVALHRLAERAADDTGPLSQPITRRRFLLGTLGAAAFAALSGFGGRALQHARFDVSPHRAALRLPGAADAAPPLSPRTDLGVSGTPWATPNNRFYRVDTALSLPQVEPASWLLRIHGMVDREMTVTFDELLARPLVERWITLACVSNVVGGDLVGNARWLGARLADVLREAGVHAAADQLLMTSVEGMTIGAPLKVLMDGRDALLALGMNGEPLPVHHGFPVRVVVPGLYGYVSACKWVTDLEVTTYAKRAYWVEQGWVEQPDLELAARIDTPRPGSRVKVGQARVIGGVAWDQHVGVSKVEVQIGNGPWQEATLAAVPSTDTWRQWALPWTPQASGVQFLRVRATDAAGKMQADQIAEPFPAGATGWHSVSVAAE